MCACKNVYIGRKRQVSVKCVGDGTKNFCLPVTVKNINFFEHSKLYDFTHLSIKFPESIITDNVGTFYPVAKSLIFPSLHHFDSKRKYIGGYEFPAPWPT